MEQLKRFFSGLLDFITSKLTVVVLIITVATAGILVYQKFDNLIVKTADQTLWNAKKQLSELAKELRAEVGSTCEVDFASPSAPSAPKWMDVERKSRDAVVQVRSNMFEINWLEPFKTPETAEGVGSGFIFSQDGSVLTNFHVVGNSLRIQLQVPSLGKERIDADVVGVSPERDIALLKITPTGLEKIIAKLGYVPVIELGSSDSIKRGTEVLAMGYPLAKDHIKSTQGIISGWEKVRFGERDFGQICIETTAPINPGNSGGPSIAMDGKVIGINFAGVVGAQNVGYIIPIDDIRKPIQDMYTTRLLRKIKLGCVPQANNAVMSNFLNNPSGGGIYITKVLADSIAEKAGLKEGDVIYQVNDFMIDNFGEVQVPWNEDRVHFTDLINRYAEGEAVELLVYRNGVRKLLTAKLEDTVIQPKVRIIFPGFEKVDYEIFGGAVFMEFALNHLPLAEKNPKLLRYTELEKRNSGLVVVTNVMQTSPAQSLRGVIAPGFIVEAVNGNKISSLSDLRQQIKNSLGAEYLRLKGDDNECVIFNVAEVLKDEPRLAKIFQFDSQHSMSFKYLLESQAAIALPTN